MAALPGRITGLAIDRQGNSVVAGVVGSYATAGIDTAVFTNGGMNLRFVARVDALARAPAFVAIVGSPTKSIADAQATDFGRDEAAGIALDRSGNAYLVAYDGSKDYPLTGGSYTSSTGRKYVFRVTTAGVVSRYSAALDSAIDRVGAMAIDATGAIYLTGSAHDGLQTTPGAPYPTSSVAPGCIAPYVTKIDASGQNVLYATYLGTSGLRGQICGGHAGGIADPKYVDPTGFALTVDDGGNAFVAGQAEPGLAATPGAVNFGTTVAGISPYNGVSIDQASHAFVTKLDPTGTAIVFTARLGGSLRDRATSVVIDGTGAVLVAGKTSSHDFPTYGGGPEGAFPYVASGCALRTPEVGFVSRLSADGAQLLFSNYLPLDGGQFDDCPGSDRSFTPARIALDAQGNIVVMGVTTASNRSIPRTIDAMIPSPSGSQSDIGSALLQILSADGRTRIYSTPLPFGVYGVSIDPWQSLMVAAGAALIRISPGAMPVVLTIGTDPVCADRAAAVTASVAASNDVGTVEFLVDGASAGSATISGGKATRSLQLNVGVRQLRAIYHGGGAFDGAASTINYLGVNQAGTCP